MNKTTLLALCSIIGMLTFAGASYAKTPGESLDSTLDKAKDSIKDSSDRAKDNYEKAKDNAKDKYNDTLEKIKAK